MKVTYRFANGEVSTVEVDGEIAEVMDSLRKENASNKKKKSRHCVSLDSFSYEGDIFKDNASAKFEANLTRERKYTKKEKVEIVLGQMKPKQSTLLRLLFFVKMTQKQVAAEEGVSQPAISQRLKVAKKNFYKIFQKLF